MAIKDSMLPEFDQEMATTRKTLAQFPENKAGWKPHEKSMPIDRLAGHIAELAGWCTVTIQTEQLDFAPVNGPAFEPKIATTRAELLEFFDKNVAEARVALAGASDETLMKPWSLLSGGNLLLTLPRAAVLRTFVISHIIHHRAQLGVYLRLNDISVPSVYGPSADEKGF